VCFLFVKFPPWGRENQTNAIAPIYIQIHFQLFAFVILFFVAYACVYVC
jgi:hypothetical protein